MSGLRLVLADDQAMVLSGLAMILSGQPDLEVVAQCPDGLALVDAVAELAPDVVLTDVRMPGLDGIEATRRIRARPQPPPVLALTTFDDDEVLWPALDAGVSGFVLKGSPADALVAAVRCVTAGGVWLDPRVLPRVLQRATAQPAPRPARARDLDRLTPREREVLDLVCTGASNAEIATTLHTAERTVKSQVSAILQKLGARDRATAIVAAYEGGWRRS